MVPTDPDHERAQPSSGGAAVSNLQPLLLDFLDDVSARAAERLGPIAGVAITLGLDDIPITVGASSELALSVDLLQYSIGVGPCLHALHTGEGMYVPDLGADHRWGTYGPQAAAQGAASCISVPVLTGGSATPAAVLKVYSDRIDGLSAEQRATAARVALEVAGGIGLARHLADQAHELDDRTAAMDTRRTIDLALGILMERTSGTADEAFQLLRRYSQQYNVKINEAARQVVGDRLAAMPGADQAPFRPHQR